MCPECNCTLTLENRAKKDKLRYRGICRDCFRKKRSQYLKKKKHAEFMMKINSRILSINFERYDEPLDIWKFIKTHISSCFVYIKKLICKGIDDAL